MRLFRCLVVIAASLAVANLLTLSSPPTVGKDGGVKEEGQFFAITKSKAESAGRTFERVNPRYTSQTCSNCGHRQKMPLAIRVYECEKCGFVCDRDHNAAINLDTVRPSGPKPDACGERQRSKNQERDGSSQSKPQRGGD